ncbi:MAG TPA: glycosyltransferase, partial [Geminicoccaceae bacterium]|nr:glycosyltransferase [Geminicoccaceae bacterium]
MSSMPLAGSSPSADGRTAGRWRIAEERVWEYLRAAGLDEEAASHQSSLIVARCAAGVEVDSTDEAVLVALRQARLEILGREGAQHAGAAGVSAPSQPMEMRPRALGSVVDWRRAAWRLRRMVVPRPVARDAEAVAAEAASHTRSARRRRLVFTLLIGLVTFWGTNTFLDVLATDGLSLLDLAHTAVFAVLLLWLAQSFWTLSAGSAVILGRLLRRRDVEPAPAPDNVAAVQRTALVMPIYNEGTGRVFEGLRAIWEDLAAAGPDGQRFDLFILSDTTDPDVWLAEIEAWQDLRRSLPGGERIFYRRRLVNKRRKTGNIEDFLSRWGKGYAYMLVLDADSLMTARAMLELARRMDANPRVGLIQAPPKLVRGRSLFARALQFAGELYGPLAATGTSYWAMGEGNYWGHNAIIRIAPFVKLCGLPLLPGRAPLGGEILSHDFV